MQPRFLQTRGRDRPTLSTRGHLVVPEDQKSLNVVSEERRVQVLVRDNNVDQALRVLKKKMQREGVFREMNLRSPLRKTH